MKKENYSLDHSQMQNKPLKKKHKKIRVCKTITNDHDDEEEEKLRLFRREFPAAFDRFLHDNGGRLPIYKPLSTSIQLESESLLPLPSKVGDIFHEYLISDEETDAYCILCNWGAKELVPKVIQNVVTETSEKRNAAIFSDIWIALSIFFCIGSSYYMPEDDDGSSFGIEEESMQLPSDRKNSRKKKIKKKKSFVDQTLEVITSSLEIFDTTESQNVSRTSKSEPSKNVLEFSKCGDYKNDMQLLRVDLGEESQRIIKLFLGILRERDIIINWKLQATKKEVTIHTCDVEGSVWQAVKSDCIIKQDKFEIVKLLMDDTRSHEYDDTMEGYQPIGPSSEDSSTNLRRYYYKPIWPTTARDFILFSTWKELDDGSILLSTISPPDSLYPHNDGYLRAEIKISGALIRPIESKFGGGCAVTMIGHSDPKGSLPSFIINQLSVTLPLKVLTKIRNILEK